MNYFVDSPSRMALLVGVEQLGRVEISGKKLARERLRRALTQEELARAIGKTGANVRRIEARESTSVYLTTFRELARWLEVSLDDARAMLAPGGTEPPAVERVPPDVLQQLRDAGQRRDHEAVIRILDSLGVHLTLPPQGWEALAAQTTQPAPTATAAPAELTKQPSRPRKADQPAAPAAKR